MNRKRIDQISILECTLRDGSYAIDYQFTAEDTAIIAAGLAEAGFKFIEIGHGLGLSASSPSIGIAAATDEEYLEAVSAVLTKAKFGMFFIPGIGRLQDLDLAAKYGMGFIRVGTNITEVHEAEPFIKRAKELGMIVSSNLMKSYALPVDEFTKQAELAFNYGADIIAVVDSAGGMMPDEVRSYVKRIKNATGAKAGFHGHNNLLLAVANTLEAVNAGAEVVDSSLQGMGRSAGNAQTEILVILLEKMGYHTGVDLYKALDLGEKVVKPMMGGNKGIDDLSAILGLAQFHSSYLKIIYNTAQKYNIDPRELVVKVSEIDRVKVTEELAERVARDFCKQGKASLNKKILWNINLDFQKVIKDYADKPAAEAASVIALEMLSLAKKAGKQTVFTIAGSSDKAKKGVSFPFIRQNAAYIIGNAEIAGVDQAVDIAKALDGKVDYILVDVDHHGALLVGLREKVAGVTKKSKVLTYKDTDAQLNAVDALIAQLFGRLDGKHALVLGNETLVAKLVRKLLDRGVNAVCDFSDGFRDKFEFAVALSPFNPVLDHKIMELVKSDGIVIDAGPGSVYEDAIGLAFGLGIQIYRVDMRAGLSGEIVNVLETYELINKIAGRREIDNITVVAGGVLGRRGDLVVDSINKPIRVIGVADGKGGLLGPKDSALYNDALKHLRQVIAKRLFS